MRGYDVEIHGDGDTETINRWFHSSPSNNNNNNVYPSNSFKLTRINRRECLKIRFANFMHFRKCDMRIKLSVGKCVNLCFEQLHQKLMDWKMQTIGWCCRANLTFEGSCSIFKCDLHITCSLQPVINKFQDRVAERLTEGIFHRIFPLIDEMTTSVWVRGHNIGQWDEWRRASQTHLISLSVIVNCGIRMVRIWEV